MIQKTMTALATATTLVLAACGGDSTAPAALGTISFKNESNTPVVSLQFTHCEDESWGVNRLGGSSIATNEIRNFPAETGCYDIKASNGGKSGYWYDYMLEANDTIRVALSSAADLTVAPRRGH